MQPAPYIDIHTHRSADGDPLHIGTFLVGRDEALPAGKYAAGIHPWQVERIKEGEDTAYRKLLLEAITPRCIAIGETGLDYAVARRPEQRTAQMRWFRWQLDVAQQHRLPAIIHCVRAYNDLIPEVEAHKTPVIIHGFTGSTELAGQLLRAGCRLSFGERSVRSAKTAAALRTLPLDSLFFETDESDLPIEEVYAAAADIIGVATGKLREEVYANYRKLFNESNENIL